MIGNSRKTPSRWCAAGARKARSRATWASGPGCSAAGSKKPRPASRKTPPQTLEAETPERRELRRLRLENEHLLEPRDILKKALGICSAQVPAHVSR